MTVAQVESFFNAHGAKGQSWYWHQNATVPDLPGCSRFCGEPTVFGAEGTCDPQAIGPTDDVSALGISCYPDSVGVGGVPTSDANAADLTLMKEMTARFAPSVSGWVDPKLNAILGGTFKSTSAVLHRGSITVTLSSSDFKGQAGTEHVDLGVVSG